MTNSIPFQRQALRAAIQIRTHLVGPARQRSPCVLPQAIWQEMAHTAQHLQHAEQKQWPAAAASLKQDLHYSALRLQREMEILRQELAAQASPQAVAAAREIVQDLWSLADEFDDVVLDLQQQTIRAVTPAIELEGVRLGPFQIALAWTRIGQAVAYECRALVPSRPAQHDGVTHPHVLDHRLCEGEGAAAIQAALTTGRFHDFFVLVRQILSTYNSGSAHVALEDWDGSIPCHGCGVHVSEDDDCSCEACHERFCGDCTWTCQGCCCSLCTDCAQSCSHCHERYCDACLAFGESPQLPVCKPCRKSAQSSNSSQEPTHEKCQPAAVSAATSSAAQIPAAQIPAAPISAAPTHTVSAPATDSLCLGQVAPAARPRRNRGGRIRRQPSGRPAARRRRAARPASVHRGDREVRR